MVRDLATHVEETSVDLTWDLVINSEWTCPAVINNHVILGEVTCLVVTNNNLIRVEGTRRAVTSSLGILLEEIVVVLTSNQVAIIANLAANKVIAIKIVINKIHADYSKVIVNPSIIIKQILIVEINS